MFILTGFHHESTVLYCSSSQCIPSWSPTGSAGLLSVYSIMKPSWLCRVILSIPSHSPPGSAGFLSVHSIKMCIGLYKMIVCLFYHEAPGLCSIVVRLLDYDASALRGYSLSIPSPWSPLGSAGLLSVYFIMKLATHCRIVVCLFHHEAQRALQDYCLSIPVFCV